MKCGAFRLYHPLINHRTIYIFQQRISLIVPSYEKYLGADVKFVFVAFVWYVKFFKYNVFKL